MPELVFVGTGDAFGSGGRRNSAILLRGGDKTLLLDCGPSSLIGLKSLGIDPLEIDAVAISHFHGDHAAGLPFLLLDYLFEGQRRSPLQVLGPPGIEERLSKMTRLFEYSEERPYRVLFSEFDCEKRIQIEGMSILPFPAFHHPETLPHMLRVECDGRALFFSGDTGWRDDLPEQVGEVDLFVSEATQLEDSFEYHLSCARLRKERKRFRCKRTILTHLGREVLQELDRVPFDTARDGLVVQF